MSANVNAVIDTLKQLIAFPSVSASSNVAITDWCSAALTRLGFDLTRSEYCDDHGVCKANLVAIRKPQRHLREDEPCIREGVDGGGLAYFCHTDVVPAQQWIGTADRIDDVATGHDPAMPFTAVQAADRVYGRGACDMKGSIAAMLSAIARIDQQTQRAPIWFVCTADEEVGFAGAKHVVRHCPGYRQLVEADPVAIIGEPTEMKVVYAHKGIRGFKIHSRGRAGHSATRYGINANEAMVPMLDKLLELCRRTRLDRALQDDRFDPPLLSWNFGVSDHSHVINITPERCDAWVSLRTMPQIDGNALVAEAEAMAAELGLTFRTIEGCEPLWTDPTSETVVRLQALAGTTAQTVCYATDGGVLSELSRRVVIGPGSIDQAHTVDEWISIEQLQRGVDVYESALRYWCL